MLASVLEEEAGAGNEILHRLGDENLGRTCHGGDPGADRPGDPRPLGLDDLALARVQSSSDLDAKAQDALGNLERAANRPGRSVEGRVEAVASRVVLRPPE